MQNLPWNLADVVQRIKDGETVHAFELEHLASHLSGAN